MNETYLYTCKYCKKEFVPKKRRTQKFCSDSCRSSQWQLMNPKELPTQVERGGVSLPKESKPVKEEKSKKKKKPVKVERVSAAGVGNAALGSFAANALTNFLTKDENKPLTKGDMMNILSNIQRFQKVNNLPPNEYGQQPFIDITTGNIEYIGMKNSFLDNN